MVTDAEIIDEASDLAATQYKEGVVDYLVLLDAQRERLNAEDAQALGETDQYRAIVAIYKSLGGGWDSGETRLAKND
ncbi:Outer membrane protein OprM precursor [compost metagenome]